MNENEPGKEFKKYKKIYVGVACQNCSPHTHFDHSMNAPQLCLIEGCTCLGLKLPSLQEMKRRTN